MDVSTIYVSTRVQMGIWFVMAIAFASTPPIWSSVRVNRDARMDARVTFMSAQKRPMFLC